MRDEGIARRQQGAVEMLQIFRVREEAEQVLRDPLPCYGIEKIAKSAPTGCRGGELRLEEL